MSSRRTAIKNLVAGSVAMGATPALTSFEFDKNKNLELKGSINHSVCQWTYNFLPLEELCKVVKEIGFNAIDLIGPKDWPTLQKFGIFSSMCYIGGKVSLTDGWNTKDFHEQLIKDYTEVIPLMVKAGYKDVICFSGSRRGMEWRPS